MNIQTMMNLHKSNRTVPSHPLVFAGRVGIEVELEGLDYDEVYNAPLIYWEAVSEDSLRNGGVEFITRMDGIEGEEIIKAVKELDDYLSGLNPVLSWRCSNHVHVDVRDLGTPELKRLILASVIVEDILYAEAGLHRKASNFCMPISIAESLVECLGSNWHRREADFIYEVTAQWNKYTGMNLLPITRLGTVEYRNSEPKFRRGEMLRLVNRFLAIKKVAKGFIGTDEEFINSFNPNSVIEMFGGYLNDLRRVTGESIEKGKTCAYDIINYCGSETAIDTDAMQDALGLRLRSGRPVRSMGLGNVNINPFISNAASEIAELISSQGDDIMPSSDMAALVSEWATRSGTTMEVPYPEAVEWVGNQDEEEQSNINN